MGFKSGGLEAAHEKIIVITKMEMIREVSIDLAIT
jgi:hypothetical protein